MANTPHHDDDQSKKKPGSGATPKKPAIPNMTLDDDEAWVVEEVVEAEVIPVVEAEPDDAIPVVEAAPESDIVAAEPYEDATVLSADDVVEEIAEAAPASDVFWGEEYAPTAQAETPDPRAHTAQPATGVKPSGDVPASEVNLAELFGDAYAPPPQDVAKASAPTAELPAQVPHIESTPAPASDVYAAEEFAEAEPATAEEIAEAESGLAEAEPASAEEIAEAESGVFAAAEAIEEVAEEVAEVAEVETASAVEAIEEAAEEFEEVAEVETASAVEAVEEVAEEVAEVAEVETASAVQAVEEVAEEVAEVAEVETASAVEAVEEVVEEVAEEADDVFAAEEVSAPASEMNSGELVEELAEELAEEVEEAEPASAVVVQENEDPFGATEFMDAPAPLKAHDSSVLASEPAHTGSSAVLFDEVVEETGKKTSSATPNFEKTAAFDGPLSDVQVQSEPDSLVTEEEVVGDVGPASAVNLGEVAGRKSAATGIDRVAEALESGVGLDSNELANTSLPEPSVEFDEILDEIEEASPKSRKKKKVQAQSDDEATELAEAADDEAAEIFDMDEEPVRSAKNGKAKVKATGDDIDLEDVFADADAVEAAEAVDAEAEADEAFAEVAGAAEDDDAPKKKKVKAKAKVDDDDEIAEAVDDDDDFSAKKVKGKKDKATVAPAYQGPGFAARWAGRFFLIFVGMILIVGVLGAGLFFAAGSVAPLMFSLTPDDVKKEVAQSLHKVPAPPKVDGRTQLDKHREALAKGEYEQVAKDLASATDEAELDVRGQAKWLAYVKQQAANKAPLDKAAPQIKDAKDDLTKAKNVGMIAQINALLSDRDNVNEIAKLKMAEAKARTDKEKAEKDLDNVAEALVKGEHLKDKKMFNAEALEKIMKSLSDDRASLEAVNKILTDAKYKDGEEGLKSVLKDKKAADDNFAAVAKVLDNEKTKEKGDKGVLEIVDARNKANTDLTSMTKDRDDVLTTIKRAYDELIAGKIVADDKGDPRKDLVPGVQLARKKAESPLATPLAQLGLSLGNIATGTSKTVEQTFGMTKAFAELGFFRTREEFIQTPQQKMDTYITLLQDRKETDAKALNAIITEAKWVLAPASKSTDEQKAKALYVQGLALRNQEKFTEAKAAFAGMLKSIPSTDKSAWAQLAHKSHQELIDPSAYYAPRAERLQSEGNIKGAVNEINSALKAIPDDAKLLAQRALIRLELARGLGGKVSEVLQKGIREDAEIAGKNDALAAESMYILGLLEEELGNVSEAEKLYRSAIKTRAERKTSIDDGGKYRVALARLLLRDRTPVIAVPPMEEKKAEEKKADVGATSTIDERILVMHPWTPLVVSALIAQPGFEEIEDKETLARLNETVKLANELIASTNSKIKGQGYMLLGSAYSKLGRRSDGLKEYSKGLQLLFPGMQTGEMNKLIEEHPAFQQPDSSGTPNPVMAERHFGEGMHFYWAKQYTEAETQFRQAVKYYDKDARYQYYLGLAQIGQASKSKRDSAIFAFEQGARLEARTVAINPLAVRDINASLERIQGELRAVLNSYRYKASAEPEVTK